MSRAAQAEQQRHGRALLDEFARQRGFFDFASSGLSYSEGIAWVMARDADRRGVAPKRGAGVDGLAAIRAELGVTATEQCTQCTFDTNKPEQEIVTNG